MLILLLETMSHIGNAQTAVSQWSYSHSPRADLFDYIPLSLLSNTKTPKSHLACARAVNDLWTKHIFIPDLQMLLYGSMRHHETHHDYVCSLFIPVSEFLCRSFWIIALVCLNWNYIFMCYNSDVTLWFILGLSFPFGPI